MPRAKKKAQETQVLEDDISNDDSAQTLPAKTEFEALQKLAAKLERENKALKRSQAQVVTVRIRTPPAASQLVNNDDSDTGDANSPFQSQGTIQVTQPPLKRLTHLVNDPKTPVIAINTRQEHSPTPAALPARDEYYACLSSPPQPYDYRHSWF
ncbi:hypothetical protein BC835DRAFT_1423167 [Cytidiella melzeri]|nr:hypothetical protein BC835DRAFT_1423167 [Cytidiella melzeri]